MSRIESNAAKVWEGSGLKCAVLLMPRMGHMNGYVQLPEGHPYRGKDYDDIDATVHGGLTYADDEGWVGFDTAHSGDIWPGSEMARFLDIPGDPYRREWTQRMVEVETENLAAQLAALAKS